jgi:hypothetical protein
MEHLCCSECSILLDSCHMLVWKGASPLTTGSPFPLCAMDISKIDSLFILHYHKSISFFFHHRVRTYVGDCRDTIIIQLTSQHDNMQSCKEDITFLHDFPMTTNIAVFFTHSLVFILLIRRPIVSMLHYLCTAYVYKEIDEVF